MRASIPGGQRGDALAGRYGPVESSNQLMSCAFEGLLVLVLRPGGTGLTGSELLDHLHGDVVVVLHWR